MKKIFLFFSFLFDKLITRKNMSSRALRRLQKEQIPDIIKKTESDVEEEEEEEEEYVAPKKFNPFDLVIHKKELFKKVQSI